MRRKGLDVSPDLILPLDAVTQTFALLAVRRAGKSNAAAVMAEVMFVLRLPFVVIDPKGDWWGLRSSKDGKTNGLPIPIFGGLHGDMPLTPESGALMATLIVEYNMTCVLDVSRFSKAARARFLAEFAERLYSLHQESPQPRHLFIEEADRVVPQQVLRADAACLARCVGAFSDIVRLGGAFGLGATLISQRSALISKDVLTQVETMIAMRTTSPQDRKAIRDWMEHHAISAEIVESLPSLLSGEAWVSSSYFLPEHGLKPIQRIRFHQRATFDSGATPKVGQQRKVATLADIDLGDITAQMAEVTEAAERNDPKALHGEIIRLKKELALARQHAQDPALLAELELLRDEAEALRARPPQVVEVPAVDALTVAALGDAVTAMRDAASGVELALSTAPRTPVAAPPADVPALARARPLFADPLSAHAPRAPKAAPAADGDIKIGKAHRAFLTVLAQFPDGRSRNQLAMLSGYSVKSSMMDKALSQLRQAGYVQTGQPLRITAAGLEALGDFEPLPSGPELIAEWMRRLGKAEGAFLRVLLDEWPRELTRAQIVEATGYSDKSSMTDKALSRLRTLELITGTSAGMTANETLAREGMSIHA
jgi:hypothetical protein